MTSQNDADELSSIATQLKEQVTYFQELGVEFVKPTQTSVVSNRSESAVGKPTVAAIVTKPLSTTSTTTLPAGPALFSQSDQLIQSDETFEDIHAEIGDCTRCPLNAGRTNVVHTEGNRKARLMFVGEAPGADEDAQARPFVGRAGQLLTKIIEAIGYKREEVLIGNVNRCRPPGNRPPTAEEAAMCKPFLLREIASVQPEVIVVLGNTATHNLLETKQGITRLRGNFQNYKGVPVMPTFHPAYLLRDPSKKRETWDDLKKVRDFLDSKKSDSK